MNSREKILQTIGQNKPAYVALPPVNSFITQTDDLLNTFAETLTASGGFCTVVADLQPVKDFVLQQKQKGLEVIVGVEGLSDNNIGSFKNYSAVQLQQVDTVVVKGSVAVAENGAIWVTESSMGNRVLPFISEHLIIVIDKESIVANMHEAYKRITIDKEGYGVFIAGPSKTADIEQSLVVGAHGPLSLQVYII